MVLDAAVLTEPRVWLISKVNRSNVKGIAVFTATQELENQHTVKADQDEDGNVIAWWADWNKSAIEPVPAVPLDQVPPIPDDPSPDPEPEPEPQPLPSVISAVTCSGKQNIKVGGSPKTFTVTFYDEYGKIIVDHDSGSWFFTVDGEDVSAYLTLEYVENKVKVKMENGADSYIGKILTVTNKADTGTVVSDISVEIVAL